ncbi:allergen V5/Tpx-1-like protein [Burkholderia lata]|uniref:CAP domain-containing protein n=1 Tax=Burkholderia lata (strain ATCC 17760 / DSM 23089 / LMG 22485 / NCIMB 9086 / R18194 / 383) TaxID=482957 RepID=UPI0014532053|nr:CAP domain-containing protein [Burkholderia lata]VWC11032.1 allergen V5/Tpx-1-like protein [Burkholderia lata]
MNKKSVSILAAISLSVTLAACGGGGDGGNNGTNNASTPPAQTTPPTGTSVPPQTSAPNTTYAAGSMQASAFSTLNAYRLAMGVGVLAQDQILDTSAQAHSQYVYSNLSNGKLAAVAHDEVSTFADYYADTPLARARKAGAPVTEWIGEVAAQNFAQASAANYGTSCVSWYLNTVYHLQSVTSSQQTVGIGFKQPIAGGFANYTCVLDFGQTAGVTGTPGPNTLQLGAGQQMPTTAIAHSPLANETNVARAMSIGEAPNPAPDVATPGRPIMVMVNAAASGDLLTVSSFTLTAANGTVVPARIIVPSASLAGSTSAATADPNNELFRGVAFLLPLAPLTANTTYTVQFNGARNSTPINTAWTFTTAS